MRQFISTPLLTIYWERLSNSSSQIFNCQNCVLPIHNTDWSFDTTEGVNCSYIESFITRVVGGFSADNTVVGHNIFLTERGTWRVDLRWATDRVRSGYTWVSLMCIMFYHVSNIGAGHVVFAHTVVWRGLQMKLLKKPKRLHVGQ